MTTYTPIQAVASSLGISPGAGFSDINVNLGFDFIVTASCTLNAVLWYQPTSGADTGSRQAGLWSTTDGATFNLITSTGLVAPTGTGWQTLTLGTPQTLTTGVHYIVGVLHPNGGYANVSHFFDTSMTSNTQVGPVTVLTSANALNGNGLYKYGGFTYPNTSFNATNYWTDISVSDSGTAVSVNATGATTYGGSAGVTQAKAAAAAGATTYGGTASAGVQAGANAAGATTYGGSATATSAGASPGVQASGATTYAGQAAASQTKMATAAGVTSWVGVASASNGSAPPRPGRVFAGRSASTLVRQALNRGSRVITGKVPTGSTREKS